MSDDIYRPAASILVLRPVEVCKPGGVCETIYSILLLHKPRKNDAWQLPQGGVEAGESVTEAALRELNEEASLTGCTVLGVSARVYQYDFPESFRRFRPDNVKGQKICFIAALAGEDTAVTVDGKEVDEYVWTTLSEANKYIHRKEYLELVTEIYREAVQLMK